MSHFHDYEVRTTWQGNRGEGTASYRGYDRAHVTVTDGRPPLPASSDPAFRGDGERWNPELLLVAALSQCHLLSYLHCCATGGVVVTSYEDAASGRMEQVDAGGHFVEVTLRPKVTVASPDMVD